MFSLESTWSEMFGMSCPGSYNQSSKRRAKLLRATQRGSPRSAQAKCWVILHSRNGLTSKLYWSSVEVVFILGSMKCAKKRHWYCWDERLSLLCKQFESSLVHLPKMYEWLFSCTFWFSHLLHLMVDHLPTPSTLNNRLPLLLVRLRLWSQDNSADQLWRWFLQQICLNLHETRWIFWKKSVHTKF